MWISRFAFLAPLLLFCACNANADPWAELPPDFPPPSDEIVSEWQPVFGMENPSPVGLPLYPEIRFMSVSDIHYLDPSLFDDGEAFRRFEATNDGKVLREGPKVLEMLVESVIAEDPDFLIATGDLTVNGAEASHLAVAAAFSRIRAAGIPVYAIPGNHDINNPWAACFQGEETIRVGGISPERFREIYAEAGYDNPTNRDSSSLAYSVRPADGLEVMMLDTNLYEDNERMGYPQIDGFLDHRRTEWIEATLDEAEESGRAVIVGMHHSLLHHTGNGGGTMNSVTVYDWPLYFETFAARGVSLVFSGHIHAQDTAAMAVPGGGFVYDVSSGASAIFPHAYRLVSINSESMVTLDSGRLTDVLSGKGRDDYIRRSRSIYLDSLTSRTAPGTAERFGVSGSQALTMMSYVAALSLGHFAGEEQGDLPEDMFPEARRLWAENTEGEGFYWLSRMGSDTAPKDNGILIDTRTGMWKSR